MTKFTEQRKQVVEHVTKCFQETIGNRSLVYPAYLSLISYREDKETTKVTSHWLVVYNEKLAISFTFFNGTIIEVGVCSDDIFSSPFLTKNWYNFLIEVEKNEFRK